MSASTPPPPTGNNNALYAGVAVLLLLGIGFFAWKSLSSPTPTPPVPSVPTLPSAPPTSTLRIDDIPLPPPIDAGAPDTGPVRTVTGPGPNPCEARVCKGVAGSELEGAVQFRAKQAHRCYDNALASDNTLAGKVTLNLKIGSNGSVCAVSVVSNELSNASVSQCVANAFRSSSGFPAPKGGCVEINLPINFKPGGR
ncbi:MAG: AgmX/PglI C-terminal domain-containing protein [Myxococcales bacterium]|nr:AgmX/PglI C-terminal domain-containing protein [Myxococcales bacterium]